MKTFDHYLNSKIAECEEQEARAITKLRALEERRLAYIACARQSLVELLQARAHAYRIICIEWQTEAMRAPSFIYYHAACLLRKPEFKSEAIAGGRWREVQAEAVGSDVKCEHCERLLRNVVTQDETT